MLCIKALSEAPPLSPPIALTIGSFDGLHLGHRAVVEAVKKRGRSVVVTFQNHPSELTRPERPIERLCSQHHQIDLFEEAEIDLLCLLPFTQELMGWSARTFLERIRASIPFSHLVLGHDARFGHRREGGPEVVRPLGEELGFSVDYLPPVEIDGAPVSSGRIRERIHHGDLEGAARLLGRTLSYYARVDVGAGHGRKIGFPTANLDIGSLCSPPFGVYGVSMRHGDHLYPGVANFGVAPTLHEGRAPLFEVHLFTFAGELYEAEVELILHCFLRPERRFESIEELQKQIAIDIDQAHRFFDKK